MNTTGKLVKLSLLGHVAPPCTHDLSMETLPQSYRQSCSPCYEAAEATPAGVPAPACMCT